MDQVERIANDNGGSLSTAGSVSNLESEVLVLRRELASAKMEIARLAGENDELSHVTRRLNKQLAGLAKQQRGGTIQR
jgi:regulator of replication initiation timing